MDLDAAPVGHQLSGVVEHDHTVAEQSPSLLGVVCDQTRRVMIESIRRWTEWVVSAHHDPPFARSGNIPHQEIDGEVTARASGCQAET
jgi:hypothetical protein